MLGPLTFNLFREIPGHMIRSR